MRIRTLTATAFAGFLALGLAACSGDEIEDGVDDFGDGVEDVVDEIEDEAEDISDG